MNSKCILGTVLLSLFSASQAADTAANTVLAGEPKANTGKVRLPSKTEMATPAQPKKAIPAKPAKLPLSKYLEPDPKSLGLGCASGAD
jgi:hypothetical protein